MSNKRIWLVKSSHQLLGPFNQEELEERVRTRAVSILDEVSVPGQRWRYIREVPELLHLVREIREDEANRSEVTVTSTIGTRTNTDITESHFDESQVSQIDINLQPNTMSRPKPESSGASKIYGMADEEQMQRSLAQTKRWVWVGALVAVIAIAGIFYVGRQHQAAPPPSEDFQTLLDKGIRAKNLGMKEKALSLLERAEFYQPNNAELRFHLAPLRAVLEGQTLKARRELQDTMQGSLNQEDIAEAYTAIGLTYLLEEDLNQAKSSLEKALSMRPSYTPAQLNLATVLLKLGENEEAAKLYSSLQMTGTKDPLVTIGPAIAQLESSKNGKSLNNGLDAESFYRTIRDRYDAKQEALVLAAALQLQSSNSQAALRSVSEALDWDPAMTAEHLHALLVDRQLLSWDFLLSYCKDLHQAFQSKPEAKALLAYCLLRAGDDEGAKRILSQSLIDHPKSKQLALVQIYLFQQLGREGEAAVRTQALLDDNQSDLKLGHLFRAQQCELSGNHKCAIKQWKMLQQVDSRSLAAHKGLGWNAYREKNFSLASDHVQKGLELSDNYLPLLELREVISQ